MAHFTTNGKRYREGDDLPSFGSVDATITAAGTTLEQNAPASLFDQDGKQRGFLYWDTGRRITNKRRVRWTFNHPANWSEWNAYAWYGVGGNGPSEPIVAVDAHWVSMGPIDPTPIDGPGSTFVNAPGGTPVAWPWSGNDHLVRTQWGAATLHSKLHLQRHTGDPLLDFSSWTQLIFGGDDTGYFSENDDDITTPGSGVTGIAASTSPYITAPMGSGSLIMAGYVAPPPAVFDPGILKKLGELLSDPGLIAKFRDRGDPSPEDIIRLKLISESLDLVRGDPATGVDAFEGLLGAARKMSPAQLKRVIAGTRSTLARGQAALKSIEAMAAKQKTKK
jgi:hypothetical protein